MTAQTTTPQRPARRAPGRKDRIVEAAVGVLAEHGVAGTTHRLVAQAADVPLGSLTYYFTSLADLREQAFRLHARQLSVRYAAYLDHVRGRDDLVEALTDLVQGQVGADEGDMVLAYEIYLAAMRDPALRAVTEEVTLEPGRARASPRPRHRPRRRRPHRRPHHAQRPVPAPLGREEIRTIVGKAMR